MTSFDVEPLEREPYGPPCRFFRVTISVPGAVWRRCLDEEDAVELLERAGTALDGRVPDHMANWRDDKYPDEELADRNAVVFNLEPEPAHPHAWRLTISEYADITFLLRGTDLHSLVETLTQAINAY